MLEANWLDEVLESLNEEPATICHPVSPRCFSWGDKIAEPETRMDKGFSNFVTRVTPVTPGNNGFEKKSADIEELKREQRREKVLQMLIDRPKIQRAFVTDTLSDPDNVILAMAIRGKAAFEVEIPHKFYDGMALLELIEKHSTGSSLEPSHNTGNATGATCHHERNTAQPGRKAA